MQKNSDAKQLKKNATVVARTRRERNKNSIQKEKIIWHNSEEKNQINKGKRI